MTTPSPKDALSAPTVLVIGFGNPGRLDDGLGPALAAAVESRGFPGVKVESNYQLSVEDAAQIAEHDVVIFADAHVSCADPFVFQAIAPRRQGSFTSHSVVPDAVLGLAHEVFAATTKAFLLGIRGHEFNEFEERLSGNASANLDAAVDFVADLLEQGSISGFVKAAEAFSDTTPIVSEPPGIVAELARGTVGKDARTDRK
jgi:hydrogenase maturation protease